MYIFYIILTILTIAIAQSDTTGLDANINIPDNEQLNKPGLNEHFVDILKITGGFLIGSIIIVVLYLIYNKLNNVIKNRPLIGVGVIPPMEDGTIVITEHSTIIEVSSNGITETKNSSYKTFSSYPRKDVFTASVV
jgi:hypothetical protein